jgi:serine protease Do
MRFHVVALALLALVLRIAPAGAQQQMIFSQSKLVASLLPSVVNITAFEPSPGQGNPGTGLANAERATQSRLLGSGFVIDANGTIVTNYHVVAGSFDIVITFSNGDQTHAMLRAADRLADIAILQVHTDRKLDVVRWAPPDSLHVGDPVIAIGNPLGVGMSVTAGIVSAINRNIMETPYDNYIQTDAPINHGNSGGPLFDLKGEVVGINTALISPTQGSAGLGFAIPTQDALFVIGRLEKYGWLKPGWLGVKVQQITPELANAFGLENMHGAIVAAVQTGGPAARAGLEAGDVILEYQGHVPSDERALLREIGMTPEGTRVTLRILRAGHVLDITAVVGQYPRQIWERIDKPVRVNEIRLAVPPDLGLTVVVLPEADRVRLHIPQGTPAVLVASVEPGTDAAWRGMAAGEAIERVQDQPVDSPQAFRAAIDRVRAEGRVFVALLVDELRPVHPGPAWKALRVRP